MMRDAETKVIRSEDRRRDHKPRSTSNGGHQKLKKVREKTDPSEAISSADTLMSALWN